MRSRSPIHEYAWDGDIAAVRGQLGKGIGVDTRDPDSDYTPLMSAASSPKAGVEMVRLLIQRGANVNASACDRRLARSREHIEEARTVLRGWVESAPDAAARNKLKDVLDILDQADRIAPLQTGELIEKANPLSLAVGCGDLAKIRALLDARANVRYTRSNGYDVLIDAMHGRDIVRDPNLVPLIELLIARGAILNGVSAYGESALRVASNRGRFDAVRVLLAAGADPAPLAWTPLMHAIALGTLQEVESQLGKGADLLARDSWSRTPWLLSLQVGDIAKAKLLLAAGADRSDRGRCNTPALMYPITNEHTPMLRWLLLLGIDPDCTDDFGRTPLMQAAESGATECAQILIEAGADIHLVCNSSRAINMAANIDIVRLLLRHGADLNEINDDMRAQLTRLPHDGKIRVSREEYQAGKRRRFGIANPEKMNVPFWRAMVTSGADAFAARRQFDDTDEQKGAVWCFRRFGKSITELPDGRIIEIAGEHEDHYDPDFCIYNDVVVHYPDGRFDIYGYPKDVFPPTDFHSATLVGKFIYIIGSLGYPNERQFDRTPVYRLDSGSLEIEKVETSGEAPGWIYKHGAELGTGDVIELTGGIVCAIEGGAERHHDNSRRYVLNLESRTWRMLTTIG